MTFHRNALAPITAASLMFATAVHAQESPPPDTAQLERGKYIVTTSGCHDCHTPLKLGPNGPEPDFDRALSGHPEQLVMPPAPTLPDGPWGVVVGHTLTSWSGP